ncbi:exopolysaccharide biosynthesis polyprenyl glycosylphosphotransferase [Pontibacter akesuensis]|uniref:Undecaprenyl-phosphate glucose phosphotransferase n=1 Tax=Pontibacter akesuensis TaxID=388950 RepID=A0A1I7J2C6_9BACT|nr:exopolysaccharide biosynthesis polyprenyl glycosylphosphotransferase [Pontibacter akesuensis]GHA72817.1 undecaprenyl-phosphate glucose phosphotransferase [Pontibacter akesuensis]SFU79333.1 Undecaprenyl-phosphate glucose phosphotransferase [Pontibacter akesuensis]
MIKLRHRIPVLYLGGDVLTLFMTFIFSFYLFEDKNFQGLKWSILLALVLLWFFIGYWRKLYEINNSANLRILNYFRTYPILIAIVLVLYSVVPFELPNVNVVIAFILGFPVVAIPINLLMANIDNQIVPHNSTKRTLIAGIGRLAGDVEKRLNSRLKPGYEIAGYIKCKKEDCVVGQDKVVGDLKHIHDYLKNNQVDEIVIALPVKVSKKVRNILSAADYHGVRVKYIPDYQNLLGTQYKVTRFGHLDAVNVRQLPLDETSAFLFKGSFDKIFSFVAIVLLLPIFLILSVLVKLDSPGPIFYCPIRIGKGGRPFRVYKFRSMRENDAASGGYLSTQVNDIRITRLGKFMRKYSLDELPQFLNVLLGDMSVVGPRPHRSYLNQQLQESVDKYMLRHYFKPGITGWAQVNGWRGPTETQEQRAQRTLHDLWYMENWTPWLDLKIVYLTIFSRKAYKSAY